MRLLSRVLGVFRRRSMEGRLDEEVHAHLDMLAGEYERRGMNAEEARYAARRDFGGVEQMREAGATKRVSP